MTNILLLDDHASTREPLAFMLGRESDFQVIAQVGSLAEARASLESLGAEIDVAVVDLGLPDGSGEEFIHDIRAANPEASSLVLTYFSDQERLSRAIEAGASGILHKSASVDDIKDAIRKVRIGANLLTFDDVLTALNLTQRQESQQSGDPIVEHLTEREHDVLLALAEGLSDKDIAARLSVGPATIRSHVTNILGKLGAHSRLHALVVAIRTGIVDIR